MKIACTLITLLLILGCSEKEVETKTTKKEIKVEKVMEKDPNLERLEKVFQDIAEGPKWDMTKPMLWGYFFTHGSPEKLRELKEFLVSKNYRHVKIYMSEKDEEDDPDLWWLHVEREEVHTPETLNKINQKHKSIALDYQLQSYDGWDVGPIE